MLFLLREHASQMRGEEVVGRLLVRRQEAVYSAPQAQGLDPQKDGRHRVRVTFPRRRFVRMLRSLSRLS